MSEEAARAFLTDKHLSLLTAFGPNVGDSICQVVTEFATSQVGNELVVILESVVTFDHLRPLLDVEDVPDSALSSVLIRLRKELRKREAFKNYHA